MSTLSSVSEAERPASRGSVNFSLPTGSRPTSPVAQRMLTSPLPQRANLARIVSPTNQNLIYDPNTRSFLPEAQIVAMEQRMRDAAPQPGKTKKRPAQAAGSHLSQGMGTAGGRPRGTSVDALEATEASQAAVRAAVRAAVPASPTPAPAPIPAPAPMPVHAPAPERVAENPPTETKEKGVVSDAEGDQGSDVPHPDEASDWSAQDPHMRAGPLLATTPSNVREDKVREEEELETATPTTGGLATLDPNTERRQPSPSPLPRSEAGRRQGRGQAAASAASAQGSPASPAVEGTGLAAPRRVRVASVSPTRTAHFARTPESLAVRHDPPARSISPRKSAMKHSNSPRGSSPMEASPGPDEQSLNASIGTSESAAASRKKANRVSFDETHIVVGQAALTVPADSPVAMSPQTKRQWFSIGRGKKKETAVVDEDESEVMKPRPALPSFGSVREKKTPSKVMEERLLVKPTEPSQTPASRELVASPNGDVAGNPLGQSNDHGAGAAIAQDAASKNAANISKSREPLPPKVRTVEGNGYHSDSDSSSYSVDDPKFEVGVARGNSVRRGPEDGDADTYRALASPPSHDLETSTENDKDEAMAGSDIPRIAVLSATPTLDKTESSREWPDMPGSWANNTSFDSSSQGGPDDNAPAIVGHRLTDPTPADVGIAEPDPETPRAGSPVLGEIAAYNAHPVILEEPEESDAEVFSDAAEDLSGAEGNGFMSLDAVAASPVVKTTMIPGLAISTPPDSPRTKETKEKAYRRSRLSRKSSEPDIDQGWEQVQAYWSTLSADKKRQLEEEAREEAEGSDTETEAKPGPAPTPKKREVVVQATPEALGNPRRNSNDRTYMIAPGTKANHPEQPQLRSSMRTERPKTANDAHIRKSMREPGSMRSSLRAEPPKGASQKKTRPVSLSAAEGLPRDHARSLSAASAAAASGAAARDVAPKPVLRRKGSADSDSSFKRPNRRSSNIPSFRSSMRGGPVDPAPGGRAQSPVHSSRFSMRSLSPTGSAFRRPFNSAPTASKSDTHMRSSLRSSSHDTTPTMRSKAPGKKGGFRSAPAKNQPKPARRLASRFADSSDEDEDDRPVFRSRFHDSDDSDDDVLPAPVPLVGRTMRHSAPVRGIPKRSGVEDGDSSDLPDSDDETIKAASKKQNGNGIAALAPVTRSGSGIIPIPPIPDSTPTRPAHSRKGSFMSILRRKKPEAVSHVKKTHAESPAPRDTLLERSKSDLQLLPSTEQGTGEERVSSPRLQKRNPLSRENSAAWPLPAAPEVKFADHGRPFTSDGANGALGGRGIEADHGLSERPDLGGRRFTATGLSGVDLNPVVFEGARKKKKFGALRRMFGLDE